jgi:small subunit ribosomal protein S7
MVAKFVNNIMLQGKKNVARQLVYEALDIVGKKTEQDPLDVFRKAVLNASPAIEIRPRRVGGATYQVPMEVREERRAALAIRWIKKYASERRDRSMASKLASELLAAANGEGGAIKRRDEMHRMADANRAFAHFRW